MKPDYSVSIRRSLTLSICLLLPSINACSLINPPVLDNSQNIEAQVDDYYRTAKIEVSVLSAIIGGGAGALACSNQSGGVIAACVAGGAVVGAGVGYTAFTLASNEEEAKKNAREADQIGYLERELKAEKEYLQNFKTQTLQNLAALRKEVKVKRKEIGAGKRSEKDLERMKEEIEESREKVKELLALRKQGMEDIKNYCKEKDVECSKSLLSRRTALQNEIVKLERQIDNQYALVEKQLQA